MINLRLLALASLLAPGFVRAETQLNADYLKPYTGPAGKLTVLPAPKDATLVTVTASSEEAGKGNFAWKAIDGNAATRWCASSPAQPQWLQLEFAKPQSLHGIKIVWEGGNTTYKHLVEGSAEGKSWKLLADARDNQGKGAYEHAFEARDTRFVKITCLGSNGGWASIKEVTLKGDGI